MAGVDAFDVAAGLGVLLLAMGLWLLHPSAALIGVGLLLVAGAVLKAMQGSPRNR